MSIEWYAVHTYVGQEDRVEQHLLERAKKLDITEIGLVTKRAGG